MAPALPAGMPQKGAVSSDLASRGQAGNDVSTTRVRFHWLVRLWPSYPMTMARPRGLAMGAYSRGLCQRVPAESGDGLATLTVARKYRVSTAWVRRLRQRGPTEGAVA